MPDTTSTTAPAYKPFLDLLTEDRSLPEGFDTWGFKVVRADLTTQDGTFQWPFPGNTIEDANASGTNLCPTEETGGLAVAFTLRGARDGQYGFGPVLLLAFRGSDVLARNEHKCRVRAVHVVALLRAEDCYRRAAGHDLSRANLAGVSLSDTDLSGANLAGALLSRARLAGANLSGANLSGANLARVNLNDADLSGADLTRAEMHNGTARGATFAGATMSYANLTGADLGGSSFTGAVMDNACLNRASVKRTTGRPSTLRNASMTGTDGTGQGGAFTPLSVPRNAEHLLPYLTEAGYAAQLATR